MPSSHIFSNRTSTGRAETLTSGSSHCRLYTPSSLFKLSNASMLESTARICMMEVTERGVSEKLKYKEDKENEQ